MKIMSDKRKVKEIVKEITKQKKRVANNLGKTIEKKSHLFSILIPLFAGILFLSLSILNLKSSVWFDESYSAYVTRGGFSDIFELSAKGVHPPLYYFVLKMWTSIFGTTDVSMRFMSIFFGFIAIVFIFQLIKKMFGIKAAALGTIFVAISPMFIRYAEEIGMYTMTFAIVVAATYCLMFALEKGKEKTSRKFWIIYAILMAFGMWTYYFSAFAWIAHVFIIVNHFGGFKKTFKDKKIFRKLLFTYLFTIVLYIPWIPAFIGQLASIGAGSVILPVSFATVSDFVSSAIFYNKGTDVHSWGFVFGIALIVFFVLTFRNVWMKTSKKNRINILRLSALVAVPIVLMTVFSLPPLMSMFAERYVLYSIILIWALFGIMAVLTKKDVLKCVLLILVVTVSIYGAVFVTNRETEGHITEILSETFIAADEGQPIIISGYQDYYDGIFYTTEKHPIYFFEENIKYEYGLQEPIRRYRVNVIDNKEDFLKDYESVWYLMPKPAVGEEYNIPEWAKDMRITSEISLDYHSALEFTK